MNKDTFKVGDLMMDIGSKCTYLITGESTTMRMQYSNALNNKGRTIVIWKDHGKHYKESYGYRIYKVKPHINKQEG